MMSVCTLLSQRKIVRKYDPGLSSKAIAMLLTEVIWSRFLDILYNVYLRDTRLIIVLNEDK